MAEEEVFSSAEDEAPRGLIGLHDEHGRCKSHPHVKLRNQSAGLGWAALLEACPECTAEARAEVLGTRARPRPVEPPHGPREDGSVVEVHHFYGMSPRSSHTLVPASTHHPQVPEVGAAQAFEVAASRAAASSARSAVSGGRGNQRSDPLTRLRRLQVLRGDVA